MQARLLVALTVVSLLIFSACALAEPKMPNWGDPDIVEGSRPRLPTPQESSLDAFRVGIIIVPFGFPIQLIHRDEQPERPATSVSELHATKVFFARRR